MLLSSAIKKPSKTVKQGPKQAAAAVSPPPPPTAPVVTAPAAPTTEEVASFLRAMTTTVGGGIYEVQSSWNGAWIADPLRRERLDHYVGKDYRRGGRYSERGYSEDDDSEKAQEYAWEYEYAMPLEKEVKDKLDARFGEGLFSVDIGEKGYITVTRA